MKEWAFAQTDPSEQLAEVRFFSMIKVQDGRQIEFLISVKEYDTPSEPAMRFFAKADRQTNQKHAPYTPTGWGKTLLEALAECVRAINRFPYEGEDARPAAV